MSVSSGSILTKKVVLAWPSVERFSIIDIVEAGYIGLCFFHLYIIVKVAQVKDPVGVGQR